MSGTDRVVVLDRDGTIVVDRDYLADPDGLEFLPGAAEGLRRLHGQGYRLVVISNQSGVGRGLLTLERLRQINDRLMQMVRQAGAQLTAIYCCPHRPEEQCDCRKPRAALLHQAARELGFDPHACIVVGNRCCDIELGQRVGATTVLISTNPTAPAEPAPPAAAHHVAADLLQAARIIERLDLPHAAAASQAPCT